MIKLDAEFARGVLAYKRDHDPSLDEVAHGEVMQTGSEVIEFIRDQILACCLGRDRHFTRALAEAIVVHDAAVNGSDGGSLVSSVYVEADSLAQEVYREWDRQQTEWEADNG